MDNVSEVAQAMLEELPTNRAWSHSLLVAGPRKCLLGARLSVAGVNLRDATVVGSDHRMLFDDPYLLMLVRVAGEQYPDRMGGRGLVQQTVSFNDHVYTCYADIRVVLEKTAAEATKG